MTFQQYLWLKRILSLQLCSISKKAERESIDIRKVPVDHGLMKYLLLIPFVLLLSCVMKPPVQEMSDARSAIKQAQEMLGQQDQAQQNKANVYLKSAEQTLQEAADAIEHERYDRARSKAIAAKHQAQKAARIK